MAGPGLGKVSSVPQAAWPCGRGSEGREPGLHLSGTPDLARKNLGLGRKLRQATSSEDRASGKGPRLQPSCRKQD